MTNLEMLGFILVWIIGYHAALYAWIAARVALGYGWSMVAFYGIIALVNLALITIWY